MEVFHCEVPSEQTLPDYRGPCSSSAKPPVLDACRKVLAAWAMGALPLMYPEEAGSPIGGKDFSPYVMLEVHYNNPARLSGYVDDSGMRLYVTSKLRQHDSGVLEVGLEYSPKMAIPPRQRTFTISGYCISECTSQTLPTTGIVVFASQLHTHLTGVRVITRHVRGGTELPELNKDEHYSTHLQEIRVLKKPVLVLPGDALITTCTFNTANRSTITLGGYAISDEMCVNYIHYYPLTSLEVCKSSVDTKVLEEYFRFMQKYELQETSPEKSVEENYRSIRWTPLRSELLHNLYNSAPLSMQCNRSDGQRFSGNWENSKLTSVLQPLPPTQRLCSSHTPIGDKEKPLQYHTEAAQIDTINSGDDRPRKRWGEEFNWTEYDWFGID